MPSTELLVRQIYPATATETELSTLNAFDNVIHSEAWPDDVTIPLEQTIAHLRSSAPYAQHSLWAIWRSDGCEILAKADTFHFARNQHLMHFQVSVLPEMRRRGLARRLLQCVADTGSKEGRRLLQARTFSTVPAGEAFMKHLGARLVRTRHINQLDLAELNWDLLRAWQDHTQAHPSFEIGMWKGPYPEQDLVSMAALHEVAFGRVTPEQLRQKESSLHQGKTERWTVYARERETERLVGYTEVGWSPFEPESLDQWMTCVLPEYRNRGLGRRMKAAMLEAVVREHPQIKYVRTGNAITNAPMLKINHEMGFRPYLTRKDWQVDLEKMLTYLEHR